ncbi:uncharacterized protein FYN16_005141 [Cariama cristata]
MAGQAQEPVTFEDIAVYLSRAEWDIIAAGQRELYHSVMLDNYKLLTSLGYPGPKPDILYRMERGEEPWVCTPQSSVRGDGPNSPSPGQQQRQRETEAASLPAQRLQLRRDVADLLLLVPLNPWRIPPIRSPVSRVVAFWLLAADRASSSDPMAVEQKGFPCQEEHDYCRNRKIGVAALKDHEYCHVQRIRYQGRVNKIVWLTGKARSVLHRLAKRKSPIGRIIRKAKRIMWNYKPCVNKRLGFSQGSSSTGSLSEPAVPPAKAEDDPTEGTCGAFCSPAKQEAVSPQSQSKRSSQRETSEALSAPVISFEQVAAPSPLNAAAEVKSEVMHPEASIPHKAQRSQLTQSSDAKENFEGHELVNSNHVSLHDAYKMVMRTVDHMLGSVCQNFELGGYSQHKDIWPIIIQIDS